LRSLLSKLWLSRDFEDALKQNVINFAFSKSFRNNLSPYVGGEEADLSNDLGVDVYRLLKSPVRREIILLLHSRGELTAAQLKNLLNISYGTLYYHLDFLSPLIMQVGRGRYILNDRGVRIAKRLLEEMGDERIGREKPSLGIFEKIAAHPIYFLPIGAISAGAAVIASAKLPLAFTILFLTPWIPFFGNQLSRGDRLCNDCWKGSRSR